MILPLPSGLFALQSARRGARWIFRLVSQGHVAVFAHLTRSGTRFATLGVLHPDASSPPVAALKPTGVHVVSSGLCNNQGVTQDRVPVWTGAHVEEQAITCWHLAR
jgi:hypothetical protein